MSYFIDGLSLIGGCLTMLLAEDRRGFYGALAIGAVLGALCWLACSQYSKLWNKRYQVRLVHHLLCGAAALLTLAFAVVFLALKYTKEAAYASVLVWEAQVHLDATWSKATFVKAYTKVKSLGVEDFSKVPSATALKSHIPTTHDVSILAAASTYAKCAAEHFNDARPLLSLILEGRAEVPTQVLNADVKNYFATVSREYPTKRAISMVTAEVKKGLDAQVPKVVVFSRRLAVGGFLLAQFVPFGLVGWAAYKNLKIRM